MSKIKWAVSLFKCWQTNRNQKALEPGNTLDISPITVTLEEMTIDELNYTISRFVCEVKKSDGTEFPPDTLYGLVISLQLYMDRLGKKYKFLSDDSFQQIKNTLDNVMKDHARDPSRKPKRQAQIISIEEEELMWANGQLGSDSPQQLLNTTLYLIGMNFALRGGQEHRDLRVGSSSQLKLGQNDKRRFLSYTQDVSKTNQGGLKHRQLNAKHVLAFENLENPDRCIVKLYEKYMAHRPTFEGEISPFYLRPLQKPKSYVWYSRQSVGRHKLAATISDMCKQSGLDGYRTNHSLRASAATRMFDADVDEQLICEVTGHKSNAVRSYKRTNVSQKRKLSAIIQGKETKVTKSLEGNLSVTVNVSLNNP